MTFIARNHVVALAEFPIIEGVYNTSWLPGFPYPEQVRTPDFYVGHPPYNYLLFIDVVSYEPVCPEDGIRSRFPYNIHIIIEDRGEPESYVFPDGFRHPRGTPGIVP